MSHGKIILSTKILKPINQALGLFLGEVTFGRVPEFWLESPPVAGRLGVVTMATGGVVAGLADEHELPWYVLLP